MKKFLLLNFVIVSLTASAQMHHTLPPEASVLYNEAKQSIKPEILNFVVNKSAQLAAVDVEADSLLNALRKEQVLKGLDEEGLRTVALLILVKCSYNVDQELKNKVLQIQKQEVEEMNFDKTAPLLEKKSRLARQALRWLRQMDDQTAALRRLQ